MADDNSIELIRRKQANMVARLPFPSRRAILFLALAAVVVRLAYWYEHLASAFFAVPLLDERYYDMVARAIAAGSDLTVFGGFRPLLYPAYLAMWYAIAGAVQAIPVAIFSQHILGVLTVILVALTGSMVTRRPTAGIIAGVLYLLASPPLFFEGELLIESFFTFLMTLSLFLLVIACSRPDGRDTHWWVSSGLVAGLAVQARPNALVWLPAIVVFAALAAFIHQRRLLRGAWVSCLPFLLVLILFGFVNSSQTGRFQVFTDAGGINFFVGNSRTADGMTPVQGRSVTYRGEYDDSLRVFAIEEYARAKGLETVAAAKTPEQVSRYWTKRSLAEITADPDRWMKLMARKCWLLLWNREVANNKTFSFVTSQESVILRLLPIRWWLLCSLVPLGLVLTAMKGNKPALLFLAILSLSYAAGIVVFFVNSRFRIPLWPAACILAGAALAEIRRLGTLSRRDTGRCVALILIPLSISLSNLFRVPRENYAGDYFFRSKAHLQKGNLLDAKRDIAESLRLDPANPDAAFHDGTIRFVDGDYAGACEILRRYTDEYPEESRGWSNLSVACRELDQPRESYAASLSALGLDPRNVNALLNAALIELRAGLTAPARWRLEQAASIGRTVGRVEYLVAAASLAGKEGRTDTATEYEELAVGIDPSFAGRLSGFLAKPLTPSDIGIATGPLTPRLPSF